MARWIRVIACALLLPSCACAQQEQISEPLLDENLTVQAIHFVAAEGSYRVSFREKAAVYLAAPNILTCLVTSQRLQKSVHVQFEALSLRLLSCQPQR